MLTKGRRSPGLAARAARRCLRGLANLAATGLLVAGCSPSPGAGVAERIRAANSPVVREVDYGAPNAIVGVEELLYIYVVDGTTEAQALDMWCNVAVPAGIDQLPSDETGVWSGFKALADGTRTEGSRVLAENPACPGPTPAPSA